MSDSLNKKWKIQGSRSCKWKRIIRTLDNVNWRSNGTLDEQGFKETNKPKGIKEENQSIGGSKDCSLQDKFYPVKSQTNVHPRGEEEKT